MLKLFNVIVLLALFQAFFATSLAVAANRDVCSTCTYTTIEDAVLAAQSGDVIRIAGGTYSGITNNINPSGSNFTFTVQGGYNSTFTSRNSETIITGGSITISPFFSGSVTLDGLTITAQQSNAIYFASSSANLTVNNCHIYNNPQSAIYVAPYHPDYDQDISATFNITNNIIHGHSTNQGAVTLNLNDPTSISSTINITDNVVYDTAGSYAQGVRVFYSGDAGNISIERNEFYQSEIGLYVEVYSGTNPDVEISENDIHDNRTIGMQFYGSPSTATMEVHHNRVYRNGTWGVYHYNPRTSAYYNNTIASQDRGLQLIYSTGSPSIRNNIFYDHDYVGLFMSSSESGYGGTSMLPSALRYNNFYNPTNSGGRYLHTGLGPSYTYGSERNGDFGEMNQFAWTEGNFKEDPRFVDAANGDYRLAGDSFCIDEGDPDDSSSVEPAPNDNRVNLGAFGSSTAAETSPSAVTVSHLAAAQNAGAVDFTYDTTTSTHSTWLTVEYWNGAAYIPIPSAALSGDGYIDGYLAGRMPTGTGRSLSWTAAHSVFADEERNDAKLRITAFHGNQSSVAVSPNFTVDYKAPTVTLDSPTAGGYISPNGSILSATATDGGTGIESVTFRYKPSGAGSFTTLTSDTSAPYAASSTSGTFSAGQSYVLEAVATDRAGNATTSASVTVNGCSYSLPTAAVSVADGAQMGSFTVNAPSSACEWSAQSSAGWLTVTGGSSGSGSGSVLYSIAQNPETSPRTGTISVAGLTFNVTQAGKVCEYGFSSQTTSFEAAGGNGTLSVSASPASCAWQIARDADWLTISPASGTGSAAITFEVDSNSTYAGRTATVSLGARSISITQSAAALPQYHLQLSVSGPGSVSVSPAAASCGENCYVFTLGDQVTLQSAIVNSSTFSGWTGGCTGNNTVCSFAVSGDLLVGAVFIPHPAGLVASAPSLAMTARQKSKKVVIRNTTERILNITGATLLGGGTFKYSRVKFPVRLKKGKSKSFTISFKAKTPGSYSGALVLTTDDPFAPQIVISLSGAK